MGVGVSTKGLRKVYTSPPPMGMGAAGFSMLGARGAAKKAFEIVALDRVSLEIPPGEIFGLLGPNGAGKATTIGRLTTRVRPTGGQARIGEYGVWRQQAGARRRNGGV